MDAGVCAAVQKFNSPSAVQKFNSPLMERRSFFDLKKDRRAVRCTEPPSMIGPVPFNPHNLKKFRTCESSSGSCQEKVTPAARLKRNLMAWHLVNADANAKSIFVN